MQRAISQLRLAFETADESVLPSAIMAVLIVYCLRGAKSDVTHTGVPGLIAVLLTAVIYRWKHQTLLSIFLGTAVYMMLIRVIA